jgi:hypothetical protein
MTCEKNDAGGGQAASPSAALAPVPSAAPRTGAEPEEKDTAATVAGATEWVHDAPVAVALRGHLAGPL